MTAKKAGSVDEYIDGAPAPVRKILSRIRATIRRAAPAAEESISYGVPTFKLKGRPLIYFAAFKAHVGVYPVTPDVKKALKLSSYKGGKGTVRFPLDEPIPYGVITKIVKFKMRQRKSMR